jgi:hypothetical protein
MLKYEREKKRKWVARRRAPSKITQNPVRTVKNKDRERTHKKLSANTKMIDRAPSKKALSATGTNCGSIEKEERGLKVQSIIWPGNPNSYKAPRDWDLR